MKLVSFLTTTALVAFVTFIAALVTGAGVALAAFGACVSFFLLAHTAAAYGRAPRALPVVAVERRDHALRLAA